MLFKVFQSAERLSFLRHGLRQGGETKFVLRREIIGQGYEPCEPACTAWVPVALTPKIAMQAKVNWESIWVCCNLG
jgi:hypothetical protein